MVQKVSRTRSQFLFPVGEKHQVNGTKNAVMLEVGRGVPKCRPTRAFWRVFKPSDDLFPKRIPLRNQRADSLANEFPKLRNGCPDQIAQDSSQRIMPQLRC